MDLDGMADVPFIIVKRTCRKPWNWKARSGKALP
jgi:hypothetical protein